MKFEKLEHLKDYLSSKGVSASEIIDKIGVSRSVFYKIINGEDTRISEQAVITKITTAFKGAIEGNPMAEWQSKQSIEIQKLKDEIERMRITIYQLTDEIYRLRNQYWS